MSQPQNDAIGEESAHCLQFPKQEERNESGTHRQFSIKVM